MSDFQAAFAHALASLSLVRGENDLLFNDDGRRFIDLLSGGGTTLLGHANPHVCAGVEKQAAGVWITSTLPTPIVREARALVESFFPPAYRIGCLYSTGMEANEFALRVARVSTGRGGIVGFEKCMHGKSMATASLGWPNDLVALPDQHCLPYRPRCTEEEILDLVGEKLSGESIAAVVLEPLSGTGGGYLASPRFAQGLADLCARHGTFLICDEIFTGFFRTGPAFLYRELGIHPDIVVTGKTMGNGFPVSAVLVDERHPIVPGMLPNSTYSGNSLAAAAIAATLSHMQELDLPGMVAEVERTIQSTLAPLSEMGIALRGKGALWVVEFPEGMNSWSIGLRLLRKGVAASVTGQFVRVLPAATISQENLREGLEHVLSACRDEWEHAQRAAKS